MDYIILSIDDSREAKKQAIRETLVDWNERSINCVNGHRHEELRAAQLLTGVQSRPMLAGELGVWYSTVNAWIDVANNGNAVVFEDDALLRKDFLSVFESASAELPEDADFMSLFVPLNQTRDYNYMVKYDEEGTAEIIATGVADHKSRFNIGAEHIGRAYMGYGNVAVYYTRQGAHKLINQARARGIYTPVDCFLYMQSNIQNVNGYALLPKYVRVVDVDYNAPTLIHYGEIVREDLI